jgi:pilus assembly protein CpaC
MINLHKNVMLIMVAALSAMLMSTSQAEISMSGSLDEMTASENIPAPQVVPIASEKADRAVVSESIPTPQTRPIATVATDKIIDSERMNISAFVGNSKLIKFTDPVSRVAVGDQDIVDFRTISPSEILILGKAVGTTNIILWHKNGKSTLVDASISVDLSQFEKLLKAEFPRETDIHLNLASASIVLAGSVSDALTAEAVVGLAEAHVRNLNRYLMKSGGGGGVGVGGGGGGGSGAVTPQTSSGGSGVLVQVINLLKIRDGQQVMLDVRIAEISKSLLDKLGVGLAGASGGDHRWNVISNFLSDSSGMAKLFGKVNLDAQKNDSLIKILAEPTLIAMSGQEGSFLVGGRVFIPVPQSSGGGAPVITLVEREFGVGLKFVPTVLDGGRINLKVAPEVSEIGESITFQTGTNTTILPLFTTRRVSTTVQLFEGQSLVIGGLVRNNITETIKAFPFLGELPIIGALFRSTKFQSDRTELVILVSPSLVKATNKPVTLPTDKFIPPSRGELFMNGKLEGTNQND